MGLENMTAGGGTRFEVMNPESQIVIMPPVIRVPKTTAPFHAIQLGETKMRTQSGPMQRLGGHAGGKTNLSFWSCFLI